MSKETVSKILLDLFVPNARSSDKLNLRVPTFLFCAGVSLRPSRLSVVSPMIEVLSYQSESQRYKMVFYLLFRRKT